MTRWRSRGVRWQAAATAVLVLLVAGMVTAIVSQGRSGPTKGQSDCDEYPKLLLAAQGDSLEKVTALLDAGLSPNAKDRLGWTALHWAACHGDEALVRLLLARGADINVRTASEFDPPDARSSVSDECPLKTPLFAAAAGGRLAVARLLLDHGADLKLNDPWYGTALHRAAAEGEVKVAKLLLERGADPNARTKEGETPLHWTVRHHGEPHWRMQGLWDNVPVKKGPVDAAPMTDLLAAHGAGLNAQDAKGWTALHWAVLHGQTSLATLLIQQGADPSLRVAAPQIRYTPHIKTVWGGEGQTVLHLAAASGNLALAKIAIARGAQADVRDDLGDTPLHEASRAGHAEVAAYLISQGAPANTADRDGLTPLHLAAYSGSTETLRALLDHGGDPNASTRRARELPRLKDEAYGPDVAVGQTPLHLAAGWSPTEAVQELVQRGARVNVTDSNGSTPLHLAVNRNRPAIAEVLLAHGANVNAQDRKGWTPLHDAALQGLVKCAQVLLANGANANIRDLRHNRPLDYATHGPELKALLEKQESPR
jgi:ankyrin